MYAARTIMVKAIFITWVYLKFPNSSGTCVAPTGFFPQGALAPIAPRKLAPVYGGRVTSSAVVIIITSTELFRTGLHSADRAIAYIRRVLSFKLSVNMYSKS